MIQWKRNDQIRLTWTVWVETSTKSRRGIKSTALPLDEDEVERQSKWTSTVSFSGISWRISVGFDVEGRIWMKKTNKQIVKRENEKKKKKFVEKLLVEMKSVDSVGLVQIVFLISIDTKYLLHY